MNAKAVQVALFCLFAEYATEGLAATRVTRQTGYWTNATTWTDDILPVAGDVVVIAHAVTLDESTPALLAFTNNATLTFNGWNTTLQAVHVTVNSTITHPIQTATNTVGDVWIPDRKVARPLRGRASVRAISRQSGTIMLISKTYILSVLSK